MKNLLVLIVTFFSMQAQAYFYFESGNYITNEFDATIICNEKIESRNEYCEVRWGAYYNVELETIEPARVVGNGDVELDQVFVKKIILQPFRFGYTSIQLKPYDSKLSQQQQCPQQQTAQQEYPTVLFERTRLEQDELVSVSNIIGYMKSRINASAILNNCRLSGLKTRLYQQQQQH